MNKRSKHGNVKFRHTNTDVTVNDFANSQPGKFSGLRQKKGETTKHIMSQTVTEKTMAEKVEDLSWFEKDLEDFDVTETTTDDVEEDAESPDIDESKVLLVKKRHKKAREESCSSGVVYPVDLWFLLSRFIHPESVCVFAQLCKGTNDVVHSAQFWKSIYIRFYAEETSIPDELRLSSIECIHGLRARTIRMLHFVYPPLVLRTKTSVPFENEPHCLVGQRCIITWHKKMRNGWKFYLRFRKGEEADVSSNRRCSLESPHFPKWHQDLFYNPDNNSSILEVTCPGFTPLPMVMGLILNRVYLNVSAGSMRYHRLKLVMDTSYRATTAKNQNCMQEVLLDPVLEVKVFPWWHPKFADAQSILHDIEP